MKNNHLLKQPIPVLIRNIAIPASTGMFFNTMYNVIDTFYAGLISTYAISAISISFMFVFMIIGLGYGFSSALTSLIGNARGRNKHFLSSLYSYKGIVFIPLVGLVVTILGYIYAPSFFKFMGATNDYLQLSLDYIYIIFIGNIFLMFNFAINSILVSFGDTKSYRNALIFGFFANLMLNPLFIYGFLFIPALGIKGLALSTILIQFISMFYLMNKALKTKIITLTKWKYYIPNIKIYKIILNQGIPNSLNMLSMSIGSLILMYYVSTYGYEAVAGYGIAYRIEQIILLPALGVSTATLTIVANNFGAKNYSRINETFNIAILYGFIISLIGVIFLNVFGEFIISQFDNNKNVIKYSIEYLLIEVWLFFAFVILFICVSTLQGIKKPKMIFYISIYRQVIAKLLICYIVVNIFDLEIKYLWYGIVLMIYSSAIFLFLYTKNMLREFIML